MIKEEKVTIKKLVKMFENGESCILTQHISYIVGDVNKVVTNSFTEYSIDLTLVRSGIIKKTELNKALNIFISSALKNDELVNLDIGISRILTEENNKTEVDISIKFIPELQKTEQEKITRTLKEKFRDKFGKDLITWDELEAGPEPDERLFNEVFKAFSEKEDANDILNAIDKSPLAQEIREIALGTLLDIMDFFNEEKREYTEIGMYINK